MLFKEKRAGFTIVELLIVIVVIAILAAITVAAYNGIQNRARDSQRESDINAIAKGLELHYIDKGYYPLGSGSTSINISWSTTADASWDNLAAALQPYMPKLPRDPVSKQMGAGSAPWGSSDGYDYSYFAGSYCGVTPSSQPQMYIIVYKMNGPQEQNLIGNCLSNPLFYTGSNYRVVKGT